MKFSKFLLFLFSLAIIFLPLKFSLAAGVLNTNSLDSMATQEAAFFGSSGFADVNDKSVPRIIADIIKTVLSILGILFVVLIIISGFKWMNAGGNEKTVEEAQSKIKNAIIGLIIILSAYGITAFVFKNLSSSSSNRPLSPTQNQ